MIAEAILPTKIKEFALNCIGSGPADSPSLSMWGEVSWQRLITRAVTSTV